MPKGDRRGPEGYGPMTGRGSGYCAGYNSPGYVHDFIPPRGGRGLGRGFARGRRMSRGAGYGFGYGSHCYYRHLSQEEIGRGEINYLEETARLLEEELKAIQSRIDELKDKEE